MEACERIVCYGLGHFIQDDDARRKEITDSCERHQHTLTPEGFERYMRHYMRGEVQLNYLLNTLGRGMCVKEIYAYDPRFTERERATLQDHGIHVLEKNLEEFKDGTLYYLPYAPFVVVGDIISGHPEGRVIHIIGNDFNPEHMIPDGRFLYESHRKAQTEDEKITFLEHYTITILSKNE